MKVVDAFLQHMTMSDLLLSVISTAALRNMIRQADLEGLEKIVLDGHGQTLIGETASDNQIRAFIRSVPTYMVRPFKSCYTAQLAWIFVTWLP